MAKTDPSLNTRRIILFVGLTFGLTWLYCLTVLYPRLAGGSLTTPAISLQLLTAAVMFIPALGVLLTRFITGEGLQNPWLRPHFRGNLNVYLLAWFGPGLLTLLGAGIYFLLFPGSFDPELGYMAQTLAAAGADLSALPVPLPALLAVQLVQALVLAPVLNVLTCFGEEWGWRGYLLPKLADKLPPLPLLLVSGVIWGLWHAPLTIVGHNYGLDYPGFPFTGIAAMCLFCVCTGAFLSYVTLKTGSCIPAVLGHGAINGIGAVGMFLTADGGNPFIGPAPMGIVGGLPFLALAILLYVTYFSRRQSGSSC